MHVGDVVKVYHRHHIVDEICSHGEAHKVPVYETKFLTVTHIAQEHIPYLHYTHHGFGNVYYAVDYQGRKYRKEDHWDGPRATLWARHGDGKRYDQYPTKKFSRDLTGREFIP